MDINNLIWLGQSGFLIKPKNGPTIYIDPWKVAADLPQADLILITHEHFDHCSKKDIDRLSTRATEIVTTHAAAELLGRATIHYVKPGDELTVKDIPIEVVAAYNLDKDYHPKTDAKVGYIITVDGSRLYHAGDTDFIPEMKELRADIALLPVSGTYVMTAQEAAKAAQTIKPRFAIPMHYGAVVGTEADAKTFAQEAGVEVKILTAKK